MYAIELNSKANISILDKVKFADKLVDFDNSEVLRKGILKKFNNAIGFKDCYEKGEYESTPYFVLYDGFKFNLHELNYCTFFIDDTIKFMDVTSLVKKFRSFIEKVFPFLDVIVRENVELPKQNRVERVLNDLVLSLPLRYSIYEFSSSTLLSLKEKVQFYEFFQSIGDTKTVVYSPNETCDACKSNTNGKSPYHVTITHKEVLDNWGVVF